MQLAFSEGQYGPLLFFLKGFDYCPNLIVCIKRFIVDNLLCLSKYHSTNLCNSERKKRIKELLARWKTNRHPRWGVIEGKISFEEGTFRETFLMLLYKGFDQAMPRYQIEN